MKPFKYLAHESRQGSALLLSLVFIVVFSAMAIGMASMSGANVQMAQNQRKLDTSRGAAESGLEVLRHWIKQVQISGTTPPGQQFTQFATQLQNVLSVATVTSITPVCDGSTITIPSVMLQSSSNQSFSALFTKISDDNVQLDVTGHYGPITRTIRTNYIFDIQADNVFDFGVASRGPISLFGNIDLTGWNINVESNAFIECDPLKTGTSVALTIIGNSQIAGFVDIGAAEAFIDMQGGNAKIGNLTAAQGATEPPTTEYGKGSVEFPEMRPDVFYGYAINILSPTASLTDGTFDNLRIPAGRNPSFSGHTTLRGVIFIESPNVVTFTGNLTITGIIVTDGSSTDDSGTNSISFASSIISHPVSELPLEDPQFNGIRDETGTFMMVPGFKATFTGAFDSLSGVIAANGVEFSGGAGGNINGSIINYAYDTMVLGGNSDLMFNRSGIVDLPAGFVPRVILRYDPTGYSEVTL